MHKIITKVILVSFQKKEVTALIQDILPSFYDPDEKVTLTALDVVSKIVGQHKNGVTTLAKIAKELQPLLADVRHNRILNLHN